MPRLIAGRTVPPPRQTAQSNSRPLSNPHHAPHRPRGLRLPGKRDLLIVHSDCSPSPFLTRPSAPAITVDTTQRLARRFRPCIEPAPISVRTNAPSGASNLDPRPTSPSLVGVRPLSARCLGLPRQPSPRSTVRPVHRTDVKAVLAGRRRAALHHLHRGPRLRLPLRAHGSPGGSVETNPGVFRSSTTQRRPFNLEDPDLGDRDNASPTIPFDYRSPPVRRIHRPLQPAATRGL